ncbi:MAG: hypothetical protein RPS47_10060 [Colwellia sp.]|jgi:hypothetical protein
MDEQRSQPIIETSLTELAFVFFFILLIFSSLKMIDLNDSLEKRESEKKQLEQDNATLESSLEEAIKHSVGSNDFDPKALFKELAISKSEAKKSARLEDERDSLLNKVEALEDILRSSIEDEKLSIKEAMKKLKDYESLSELLEQSSDNGETLYESVESLIQDNKDISGQNKNLRNKVTKLGNGLDHPPCWADPQTGAIQYLYDVIIHEGKLEFKPGWPESRATQALNNESVLKVLGSYDTVQGLWGESSSIYRESVNMKCRHFVRVYDHADSKEAFKKYLLGIENHFYKLLSRRKYEK